MKSNFEIDEIEQVKRRILLKILQYGTVLGSITFLIGLLSFFRTGFQLTQVTDFLSILVIFLALAFNKRLSLKSQLMIVMLGLFVLIFTDVYKYGVFSDNRTLLIFIPFFSLLAFSTRRTLLIFIFALLLFGFFAYLFMADVLHPKTDYLIRLHAIDVWIVNIMLITLSAFAIWIVTSQLIAAHKKVILDLQDRNRELNIYKDNLEKLVIERTHALESSNEELSAANEELLTKSEIINDQNKELMQTMEHLKIAQTQLVQSEKMASLGVLAAGVAHEINNPLNYILGGYTGMEDFLHEKNIQDQQVAVLMNAIKTGVDRASAIVTGLNQFSRTREGMQEKCNLHSILENCLIILRNQIKDRIEIIRNFSASDLISEGNVGKLHQVFINILLNAVQSIESAGTITISTRTVGTTALIEITDTGCGISSQNIGRITDPFFTTKEPGKGTGLGLAITFSILQEHSGKIRFQSEMQKGTTVTIELPLTS
ncbi:MAG: ATP-binding protein [Bacteroidales bacterium]